MAEIQQITHSFVVGATALTKYTLCKTPAAAVVSAAVTDDCFGIVQDGAAIGATASFCVFGKTKAIASDAIAAGAPLAAAAAGKVVTHDGTTANPIIGTALTAGGADGDEIEILLGITLRAGPSA